MLGEAAAPPVTLFETLRAQAQRTPHAWALLAPGRRPLTYAALLAQLQHTVAQLLVFGAGRGDRVAVVVNNGPEQATALLGTASGTTCAPLSPSLTSNEFSHYLARLGARALIVSGGHAAAAAAAAARELGITVLELVPSLNAPAGSFTLQGELRPLAGPGGRTEADDVALLLHTSGTTAPPRLVPLTHRHLLLSAQSARPMLKLTPADRCLNLLPYYRLQGFQGTLLAPLVNGASVVCTPGFSAAHFLAWLREYQPTWFSAGPDVHQAILATLDHAALPVASLRFLRSGGAALPLAVLHALEDVFGVPLIEGYGLTEVNPIALNPLPPAVRKAGSVGISAGPEIGIATPGGASLLPSGRVGEVVVRGPSVIAGYAGDARATVEHFTGEWLRTGDQGYLDDDGYLFVTGRLLAATGPGQMTPGQVV